MPWREEKGKLPMDSHGRGRVLDGIIVRMECLILITYGSIKYPPSHLPKWPWREGERNLPMDAHGRGDLLDRNYGHTFLSEYIIYSSIVK
jgi:hypothetical protein